MDSSKPVFTLSVAAEIVGVHPRTLMIYEKQGLVIPARTKTNRRRFSHEDINKLIFVRFLTHTKGVNLAGVAIILNMAEKAKRRGIDLTKTTFADFSLKDSSS